MDAQSPGQGGSSSFTPKARATSTRSPQTHPKGVGHMWEPPGGAKPAAHIPNIFRQEARLRRRQREWEETWRKGVSAAGVRAGGQGNKPAAAAAAPPPPGLTDVAFGRDPLAAQLPKKCAGLQRAPCARVGPGQLEPIAGCARGRSQALALPREHLRGNGAFPKGMGTRRAWRMLLACRCSPGGDEPLAPRLEVPQVWDMPRSIQEEHPPARRGSPAGKWRV